MYRIKNGNAKLGGVCLGIADANHWDVNIVRVVFVVLFFTPVPIGLIYLGLWAFLPERSYEIEYNASSEYNTGNENLNNFWEMGNNRKNGNMVGGLILIILGSIFAFKTFFDINLFSYIRNLWPLALIAIGVWIIIKDDQPKES